MTITMMKLYACGFCTHPEKIVCSSGSWKSIPFPATVALIKHEKEGYILFDTGYASRFFEATKRFPYSVYARLTPVHFKEEESIVNQLKKDGISAEEINTIVLSHFHGDHTAGLKDFPNAKILTFKKGYEDIRKASDFKALTKGCLKSLLPDDLESKMVFLDEKESLSLDESYGLFNEGYLLFDDHALIAVDLTGHAIGQFGLFVQMRSGKRVLLCADAVWQSDSFMHLTMPHPIAHLLIADREKYRRNIEKLHDLYTNQPSIDIIPTHCHTTASQIERGLIYE